MEVTCIHDGLWRWSVTGDGGRERASAYLEHGDVMLLVDPVLPPPGEDLDRFRRAIDRDVARVGGPVHVMLTRAGEPRDADALAVMTGGVMWRPGDSPPPGIEVMPTGIEGELALWSAEHSALMPGRAIMFEDDIVIAAPGADIAPLLSRPARAVIPSVGPMVVRGS